MHTNGYFTPATTTGGTRVCSGGRTMRRDSMEDTHFHARRRRTRSSHSSCPNGRSSTVPRNEASNSASHRAARELLAQGRGWCVVRGAGGKKRGSREGLWHALIAVVGTTKAHHGFGPRVGQLHGDVHNVRPTKHPHHNGGLTQGSDTQRPITE